MFKRLFWLTVGVAFGATAAVLLTRVVRRSVDRYAPETLADNLAEALRGLGTDIRAAVAEGREAMADREAELRAEIRSAPGPAPTRATSESEGPVDG